MDDASLAVPLAQALQTLRTACVQADALETFMVDFDALPLFRSANADVRGAHHCIELIVRSVRNIGACADAVLPEGMQLFDDRDRWIFGRHFSETHRLQTLSADAAHGVEAWQAMRALQSCAQTCDAVCLGLGDIATRVQCEASPETMAHLAAMAAMAQGLGALCDSCMPESGQWHTAIDWLTPTTWQQSPAPALAH